MQRLFIVLIDFYQNYLSPDQGLPKKLGLTRGGNCIFIPSCSEYTKQAIEKYGAGKGSWMGFKRILRCHPWQKNHFDPVE